MQVFLPYPDFKKSLECLDTKRLGKQRVEAWQIINAIIDPGYGWQSHPATKMFRANLSALVQYYNTSIDVWTSRGYKNTMLKLPISGEVVFPSWFGNDAFHASHRSNLLRKNYEHYSQFGWSEPTNLPYIWPV
jgi:hypothetical protein